MEAIRKPTKRGATGTLSASDLSAVLAVVHDLRAETDADRLPAHVLRTLVRMVPCKLAGYTVVDPVSGESTVHLHPPERWPVAEVTARFQAHIAEHPVVRHVQRTRDGQARAISDFLTGPQFHATGLYRDLFRWIGIEDQLSVAMVGQSGLMVGLSFNTTRRGFSDRTRALLNAVRPHALQAHAQARELHLLRNLSGNRRGTIVDQLPIGLVCVDGRGNIVWATDPSRRLLRDHYPDAADSVHGLPDALRRWLRSVQRRGGTNTLLLSGRPGLDLTAQWSRLPDGNGVVTLQELPRPADDGVALSGYGLTPREAGVLRLMVTGRLVGEAAGELSVGRRTIEKHLEQIYRKLGVRTLAAACLKVLRPPGSHRA